MQNSEIKEFLKTNYPRCKHQGISLISYPVKLGTSFDLKVKNRNSACAELISVLF